jgi:hypothetical protein
MALWQWIRLLAFPLVVIAGCAHCAPNPEVSSTPITQTITVHDIETRGVIGALGEPIGNIIVICGPTRYNGDGYDEGDGTFVRVEEVEDRALPAPVFVRLHPLDDSSINISLPENTWVSVVGYETCYYTGIPRGLHEAIPVADHFFLSEFVPLYIQTGYGPVTRPSTQPAKDNPVSIIEISRRGVIGKLGVPLGKLVYADGNLTQINYHEAENYWAFSARVDRVDGKMLSPPVEIELRGWYWSGRPGDSPDYYGLRQTGLLKPGVEKPYVGMRFSIYGYEDGGFEGTPVGAALYLARPSHEGLHFATYFSNWPAPQGSSPRTLPP